MWDLKKWAERQVSRKKLRGGETLKFKKLLQRVDTASKWNAKFVIIKGADGNLLRVTNLIPNQLARYHTQLLAMRHVYSALSVSYDTGDSGTYVTIGGACALAARATMVSDRTVRAWRKDFEDDGGCLKLSKLGRYVRNWNFDDKVLHSRVRLWLHSKLQIKKKEGEEGVFTMRVFLRYLNTNLLPSCIFFTGCFLFIV